jgi:DNA-binding MarR family transcriptional regulator
MAYDKQSTIKSEQAYQILRFISSKDEGSYATEISNGLEMDRSVVSDILSTLEELELVKEGKRTKAKYFKLNHQTSKAIYCIWNEEMHYDERIEKTFSKHEDALNIIFNIFVEKYLSEYKDSTIRKMAIQDLQDAFYFEAMNAFESDDRSSNWILRLADMLHSAFQITHLDGSKEMREALNTGIK